MKNEKNHVYLVQGIHFPMKKLISDWKNYKRIPHDKLFMHGRVTFWLNVFNETEIFLRGYPFCV